MEKPSAIQNYLIKSSTIQNLLNYLIQRPYNEVASLIQDIVIQIDPPKEENKNK